MSKTGDKIFKYALDKGRSVKNTLWIAGCFLLVAANIAFFLLFPRIVSGLAIVLSNAVTLILTFLAFKPLNSWLQDSLMERQQALIEKMEKDRELERKVEVLELENRTLADKLDTPRADGRPPRPAGLHLQGGADGIREAGLRREGSAIRDSGNVREGEYVGIAGKEILAAGPAPEEALLALAEAMDAGSRDVILVFAGEGGTRSERVREALEKRYPRAEVILQSGGQPVYEYILVLF